MTSLTRYLPAGTGEVAVGVADRGWVAPLGGSVAELLRLSAAELRERCTDPGGPVVPMAEITLLPPIDGRMEVWAAGVTYRQSRAARVAESRAADLYRWAYDAVRPELFFKSAGWRVVGHGETVAVRADSQINVPEPELAVVVNAHGEIVGYTICNDLSSRSIEGENPLYLPQAKVYLGGCALGPSIRPAWEVADPYRLGIRMAIRRGGVVEWAGAARTGWLHRRLDQLVAALLTADEFPDGVVLSTGTCLVPELPFTLAEGDRVEIEIDEIGTLRTQVGRGVEAMAWLVDAVTDPRRRSAGRSPDG